MSEKLSKEVFIDESDLFKEIKYLLV